MPEQQVAGPGAHAHTLEARGLAYVARAAVCRMQPQHIGLGAQAQVIADSGVYRGLEMVAAGAYHDRPPKSGMTSPAWSAVGAVAAGQLGSPSPSGCQASPPHSPCE